MENLITLKSQACLAKRPNKGMMKCIYSGGVCPPAGGSTMDGEKVKKNVQRKYSAIARSGGSCCGPSSLCCSGGMSAEQISKSIGYLKKDISMVPEANLGLGCGNPTSLSNIKEGDTVLDLGSGAGIDAFLAAEKTGKTGLVIGVDMTREMIQRARWNARTYGYTNTEFRMGDIEQLPVEDNTIDIALSNCVINLSPNKDKVFAEVYRVLKSGGSLYVSDIVLLEELTPEQRNDPELIAGCIGGAVMREEYLDYMKSVGFEVRILSEDSEISERQYNGLKLESIYVEARKKEM